MAQCTRRPGKSRFSRRIVQIHVEAVWQFQLNLPERVARARYLPDLVRKLTRRDCPPIDMQAMWVTRRTIQQDHVLARQIGMVML